MSDEPKNAGLVVFTPEAQNARTCSERTIGTGDDPAGPVCSSVPNLALGSGSRPFRHLAYGESLAVHRPRSRRSPHERPLPHADVVHHDGDAALPGPLRAQPAHNHALERIARVQGKAWTRRLFFLLLRLRRNAGSGRLT